MANKTLMKNKKILFGAVIALLCIIVVPTVLMLPGRYVRVVATITDDAVYIKDCYLRSLPPINILDPEDNVSRGVNTLAMTVVNSQTGVQISSNTETNVGSGNCAIESNGLSELEINTLLIVTVELQNEVGQVLSTDQTTLIFK